MRELLGKLESSMQHRFEELRVKFGHAGNKGVGAETILREFLHSYLPRRYGVGHGEVVDSGGRRSGQTDVVIVTDEHPFTFTPDTPGLFMIEGVFAIGEVKSVLTSQELEKTISNAKKSRLLQRAPLNSIQFAISNESDNRRYRDNAPYFLFAFETQVTLETLKARLQEQSERSIDAVFILNQGAIVDLADGKGMFNLSADAKPLCGWSGLPGKNTCLPIMLLWLSLLPELKYMTHIVCIYLLGLTNRKDSN